MSGQGVVTARENLQQLAVKLGTDLTAATDRLVVIAEQHRQDAEALRAAVIEALDMHQRSAEEAAAMERELHKIDDAAERQQAAEDIEAFRLRTADLMADILRGRTYVRGSGPLLMAAPAVDVPGKWEGIQQERGVDRD